MNKENLWNIYCKKNAHWMDKEVVQIRTKDIKALFDQTWQQAVIYQQEVNKAFPSTPFDPLEMIKKTYKHNGGS